MSDAGIAVLKGATLASIQGAEKGSERISFKTDDGREFVMFHHQDCCEGVAVEEVIGDIDDLIGSPIVEADESTTRGEPTPSEYAESWTWTFYKLGTAKGFVTLRWLGESNGYYAEDVSFEAAN